RGELTVVVGVLGALDDVARDELAREPHAHSGPFEGGLGEVRGDRVVEEPIEVRWGQLEHETGNRTVLREPNARGGPPTTARREAGQGRLALLRTRHRPIPSPAGDCRWRSTRLMWTCRGAGRPSGANRPPSRGDRRRPDGPRPSAGTAGCSRGRRRRRAQGPATTGPSAVRRVRRPGGRRRGPCAPTRSRAAHARSGRRPPSAGRSAAAGRGRG